MSSFSPSLLSLFGGGCPSNFPTEIWGGFSAAFKHLQSEISLNFFGPEAEAFYIMNQGTMYFVLEQSFNSVMSTSVAAPAVMYS